MLIKTVNNLEF